MTFKTHEITVDLMNVMSKKEFSFFQGDENSAKLILNLTKFGEELDLSQAKSVRATFKKPDGTTVFQDDCQPINAMKGKYQIVLKTQTLAVAGYVNGQIHITEEDRKLDTELFGFTVKKSLSSDEAVESTNEFGIIQKVIEAGEKFKNVDFAPIIKAGELAAGALPKTGGTMTGTFVLSSANAEINFKDEKSEVAIQKTSAGNIAMWDRKNQKTVWLYVPESNEFRLQAAKTNIVTKDKDTRALITVTADAELTTSDGVIADRRGNTVTLRARVRRKNEQINTVFMMPEGMKPLLTVAHNIIANDGTVGALSIGTSGDVKISSVGPSLVNKDFNFTISYVVD
ncbi:MULTISPECIES: BppU family phage baseplate upper protein [Bacillus]|uniref:BppU family phage baseplate upper protein n=1 Tax=Bacillus TaxID=1386 RepID=UPI0022E8B13A|nr:MULTISPECIES: BppU family phage baseplate upper protein [Bacillus]MDA1690229.1 BppU family phage baseplate upper protein [Bacillus cereus group sp. TH147LC]MDK7546448.1 BppU family phage baseplate upper protein [Bacillus pacificus]MDK7550534.1 BppU family phage baseplate upper protein [Bacillus pacificus]MDK7566080.1 BppU family phage baseplate upper protein [Bacillus pacificus]MDK7579265.1 BppU family phage baseplate upper protein [Bacillus pacificus]